MLSSHETPNEQIWIWYLIWLFCSVGVGAGALGMYARPAVPTEPYLAQGSIISLSSKLLFSALHAEALGKESLLSKGPMAQRRTEKAWPYQLPP